MRQHPTSLQVPPSCGTIRVLTLPMILVRMPMSLTVGVGPTYDLRLWFSMSRMPVSQQCQDVGVCDLLRLGSGSPALRVSMFVVGVSD
jgi:hypothetical protein